MSAERPQREAGIAALEALVEAPPAVEPAQALKQVSILFLDVVGSATLSQHLDPEAISAVMDDALQRGTAVVEQHRGRVLPRHRPRWLHCSPCWTTWAPAARWRTPMSPA